MHDGRFETLDDVIDHYDKNVDDSDPFLDSRLIKNNRAKRLNLSAAEKNQLKAFLLTLSDDIIESEERWSDPFVR